jgi:hypothetical protein
MSPKLARRRPWMLCIAVIVTASPLWAGGCQDDDSRTVPNRVLDRPLDVALACVRLEGDGVLAAGLTQCRDDGVATCSEETQLLGLVTNSERHELAVFRRCDPNGLVDLDPDAPGYQFVPVGQLPGAIGLTPDGCQAVTANVGSCDLSIADVTGLAARAFDRSSPDKSPGELVSTVVPRRASGLPLAARPGDLLPVPAALSLASDAGDGLLGVCDDPAPASVVVTFPACDLVAEISLETQQILQSRRFVTASDGTVTVEDAGADPECPVECPEQFDDPTAAPVPTPSAPGFAPTTLVLVDPEGYVDLDADPDAAANAAFLAADDAYRSSGYPALIVGGRGSDVLVELAVESDGWASGAAAATLQLAEGALGVERLRVTPPVPTDGVGGRGDATQFLYAIAGDGTTRVIERDFADEATFGSECDTQVDPTVTVDPLCAPLVEGSQLVPLERRALAEGPGIRGVGGATFTDWAFRRVAEAAQGSDPDDAASGGALPFQRVGLLGFGTQSTGTLVVSFLDQFSGSGDDLGGYTNAADLLTVTLGAHALWPARTTETGAPNPEALPRLTDAEPTRTLFEGLDPASVLAPALRRIDFAYANEDMEGSEARLLLSALLGNPANADDLAPLTDDSEGTSLYERAVARLAFRDYRSVFNQRWSLLWEGGIPGTASGTGVVQCDLPGWQGGSCTPPPAGYQEACDPADGASACLGGIPCDPATGRCTQPCDPAAMDACPEGLSCDPARRLCLWADATRARTARLVDESATFCGRGVLPGDKLVLTSCDEDTDCGLGQVCLLEPTAVAGSAGLCVSEQAARDDADRLRQVCAPFLADRCGPARLEYLITRAFEDELWLQVLDQPLRSYVRRATPEPECTPNVTGACFANLIELEDRFSCDLPDVEDPPDRCADDQACIDAYGDDTLRCIDERCRRPCQGGEDACILAPLPGPECFAELTRYEVRARHGFVLRGEGSTDFFADDVLTDPTTGECVRDPSAPPIQSSRIRLGADAAETFDDPVLGIPECPSSQASPSDPNPCRITTPRPAGGATDVPTFHTFRYGGDTGAVVDAIRFSNPAFSLVLDLTNLLNLASEVPDTTGEYWPPEFATFRRSRIPAGYAESFQTLGGYVPLVGAPTVRRGGSVPLTFPVRVVLAPELSWVFIVDAGGIGGVGGVRGQVMRVDVSTAEFLADDDFRVR